MPVVIAGGRIPDGRGGPLRAFLATRWTYETDDDGDYVGAAITVEEGDATLDAFVADG
jgi:hypothetical protein